MSQLRWILLTLGALFIAALAWWELRRPRQAPRDGAEHREPPLALPQIRAREPVRDLPVMHIGNDPELVAVDVPPATSSGSLPIDRKSTRLNSSHDQISYA